MFSFFKACRIDSISDKLCSLERLTLGMPLAIETKCALETWCSSGWLVMRTFVDCTVGD